MRIEIKWDVKDLLDKVGAGAADGLYEAAEYLLEEANKIVPIEEGTLQRSGEATVDVQDKQAAVSYDTPYATRLHEHPNYEFQDGRQGKWLETTIKNYGDKAQEHLVEALKKQLGG